MTLEILKLDRTVLKSMFLYTGEYSRIKQLLLLFSRYTWEIPQTLLGWFVVFTANLFFKRLTKLGSEGYLAHLFELPNKKEFSAVSLGGTIIVFGNKSTLKKEHSIFQLVRFHEYGHSVQSRILGPFYLLLIGLPSIISALTPVHEHMPWERWADKLALNAKSQ